MTGMGGDNTQEEINLSQNVTDYNIGGIGMNNQMDIMADVGGPFIDKHIVKSALKDLKDNYMNIEHEIEATTKQERHQKHTKYQKVMEKIESLKQTLKSEVNSRKETEEQFM